MSERSQIAAGIIANEIDAAKELLSGGSMERDKLAAAVRAEQEERVRCGLADLQAWMQERGLELVAFPQLSADGRVVAEVVLRAK